jgi:hypothetical protein
MLAHAGNEDLVSSPLLRLQNISLGRRLGSRLIPQAADEAQGRLELLVGDDSEEEARAAGVDAVARLEPGAAGPTTSGSSVKACLPSMKARSKAGIAAESVITITARMVSSSPAGPWGSPPVRLNPGSPPCAGSPSWGRRW